MATTAARAVRVPGDLILEPNEVVLVATRPLFLWEPLVLLLLALAGAALWGGAVEQPAAAVAAGILALLLLVWLAVRWVPWRARWYVLTDRRVIARWGVFNRHQAALLLDRVQNAQLGRPFPLSLIRDYGVIHIESAGESSREIISSGLGHLRMTGASGFYRTLTDAMTPDR
ncbi:MAG TPA: PH domain-containing protein [Candidatus Limnocylindrales bacterium]|nr:PH domain-containing protein [Candidatus Limnocylindrales bacterium]